MNNQPQDIPKSPQFSLKSDDEEQKVVETDPTGRFERYDEALGKGAYKEVFKAFDQEEGVEVAWNQLRVDYIKHKDVQRILYEIRILQGLRNDNIINLYHSWVAHGIDGKEKVCFITELMTSGTLKSFIKKTKGMTKPKILKNWARQILNGLVYLHSRNPPIIHRDLKCENIFINGNNGQAKIGDLGLATFKHREHASSVLGTPEFMAPELYDEKYDEKVDIYAFGMVILEIVTKEYPYSECSNQAQIYKKVTQGIKPAAISRIQDEETKKFVELCLQYDPNARPSAAELLKHPFFTSQLVITHTEPLEQLHSPMSSVIDDLERKISISSSTSHTSWSLRNHLQSPDESFRHRDDSSRMSDTIVADTHVYTVKTVSENNQYNLLVESNDGNTMNLRLVYASAGKKPQEIKFPFSLKTDTATDVVSEMVNEKLIEAKDEGMVRRKIEEVVRNALFQKSEERSQGSSFEHMRSSTMPRMGSSPVQVLVLRRNSAASVMARSPRNSRPATPEIGRSRALSVSSSNFDPVLIADEVDAVFYSPENNLLIQMPAQDKILDPIVEKRLQELQEQNLQRFDSLKTTPMRSTIATQFPTPMNDRKPHDLLE